MRRTTVTLLMSFTLASTVACSQPESKTQPTTVISASVSHVGDPVGGDGNSNSGIVLSAFEWDNYSKPQDVSAYVSNWKDKLSRAASDHRLSSNAEGQFAGLEQQSKGLWSACPEAPEVLGTLTHVCHHGNSTSKRELVLLGDSHAMMMLPLVESILDHNDWTVTFLGQAACPASDNDPKQENDADPQACKLHREATWAYVQDHRPDLVVVSDATGAQVVEGGLSQGDYLSGLRTSLSNLRGSGTKVMLFTLTPFYPHPAACVTKGLDITKCSADLNGDNGSLSFRNVRSLNAATAEVATSAGANVLDFSKFLCTELECPGVIDGSFVTSDGGHFTREILEKLAPMVADEFRRIGVENLH